MKTNVTILIALLISLWASIVSGEELVPIGLQKQLMVDDYVIAEKENITRKLGKPTKKGVVMEPSVPTDYHPTKTWNREFSRRLSVVFNDKRQCFQMLYRAYKEKTTAYAESKDGINWTKPLISRDGKSNLIKYRNETEGTFYESSFMIDPTVPWGHPEKYKAALNPGNAKCAMAYSADGIHWTGYNGGNSVTGRAADTYNQTLWDPIANRYMLLTRTDLGPKGGALESRSSRIMVHDKGNDLLNYPTAWETIAEINVDHPDNKLTKLGAPLYQMESMCVWVYENIYFGMMHVLTAGELTGGDDTPIEYPDKRPETDVIDFYLGTSRNAKDFDKSWIYAKKPFIPRGPDYSFDKAMLQPPSEIITRGDEHLIYYSGSYCQHHSGGNTEPVTGKVGLATLPLDRFIGQAAGDKEGTITTRPFKLKGDKLEANVDAKNGWVRIELLDENSKMIPGFSGKTAKQYKGADELRLTPQWKSGGDLSGLKGKTVKLRFTLHNARLYSFSFKSERR